VKHSLYDGSKRPHEHIRFRSAVTVRLHGREPSGFARNYSFAGGHTTLKGGDDVLRGAGLVADDERLAHKVLLYARDHLLVAIEGSTAARA
jgi:hypothetical protein